MEFFSGVAVQIGKIILSVLVTFMWRVWDFFLVFFKKINRLQKCFYLGS